MAIVRRNLGPLSSVEPEAMSEVDEIDNMVPPKIMRLTQHYHNLIYIRAFWEELGQQPPEWIKAEMTRADRVLQAELEREQGQGGRLHRSKYETGKS